MKLSKRDSEKIGSLESVFQRWGKGAVRRVLSGVKKWGIPSRRSVWTTKNCGCPISYAAGWKPGEAFPDDTNLYRWKGLEFNHDWTAALSKGYTERHVIAAAKKVLSR